MFGNNKTRLIIVCDEKTKEYANFLRQLISVNDDSDGDVVGVVDGSVEAAVWLEKEYIANAATISSNEHILFIGDNKTSRSEVSSMIVRYNQYGMKYGWLGKRGMMVVDNKPLNQDQYEAFINYCLDYDQQIKLERLNFKGTRKLSEKRTKANNENIDIDNAEVQEKNDTNEERTKKKLATVATVATVAGAIMSPVVAGVAVGVGTNQIVKGLSAISMHKKVRDQQYRALTVMLYMNGLQTFLEG